MKSSTIKQCNEFSSKRNLKAICTVPTLPQNYVPFHLRLSLFLFFQFKVRRQMVELEPDKRIVASMPLLFIWIGGEVGRWAEHKLLLSSQLVFHGYGCSFLLRLFFYTTVLQISSAFASYPDMIFEEYLVCLKERYATHDLLDRQPRNTPSSAFIIPVIPLTVKSWLGFNAPRREKDQKTGKDKARGGRN